jgi:hypothetical protein
LPAAGLALVASGVGLAAGFLASSGALEVLLSLTFF